MSTYKLTYFDVRGLGEPIRMLLSYLGKEFEDVRLTYDKWKTIRATSPFGKLPMLEVDGKILTQSVAICRYLGKEAGLAGDNAWEDLQIDTVIDTFTDFRKEVSSFHHEQNPEIKEQKRKAILKQTCPYYFDRFNKILKENELFVANGKLSWADIFLFGFSDTLIAQLQEDVFQEYPHFKKWKENISNIPAIKEWVSKRPVTSL